MITNINIFDFKQFDRCGKWIISSKDAVTVDIRGDILSLSLHIQSMGPSNCSLFWPCSKMLFRVNMKFLQGIPCKPNSLITSWYRSEMESRWNVHFRSCSEKIWHLYIFQNRDNICFALCVTQLWNPEKKKTIFKLKSLLNKSTWYRITWKHSSHLCWCIKIWETCEL